MNFKLPKQLLSIFLIVALSIVFGASHARADNAPGVAYRTVTIEDVDIFYREAGDPSKPTLLLLHGFPTSSHMFRDLITELADEYHLVAPDYPGYGYSSMPAVDEFDYTSVTLRILSTISLIPVTSHWKRTVRKLQT